MATGVGLHIGDGESTAAIVTPDPEWAAGDKAAPDPVFIVRETVLHMSDDGDSVLGGDAPDGYGNPISGFLARVGDPAGIQVDDGDAYRAEDLVATALFCLINLATEHLSGPAEFFATYPVDWSAESVSALKDSLSYLGLRSVQLLPEPETASGSGKQAAHAAALAACMAVLATPAGNTPPDTTIPPDAVAAPGTVTEEIPAVTVEAAADTGSSPMVDALAYSAVLPQAEGVLPSEAPTAAVAKPVSKAAAVSSGSAPAPRRVRRTPLLIAGVAAGLLALVGGGIALAMQNFSTTPPPPVVNAESATTTVAPSSPAGPVNFPTVSPTPVASPLPPPPPVTTRPPAPPQPVPPPPPRPTLTTPPPLPPVTTTPTVPSTTPTTTEPPTSSSTATTTTTTRRPRPRWPLPQDPEMPDVSETLSRPPGYAPGTVPQYGPWQDQPGRPPGYRPGQVPPLYGAGSSGR